MSFSMILVHYLNSYEGDQPHKSAIVFAWETTQAGASDIPTYRIFPDLPNRPMLSWILQLES